MKIITNFFRLSIFPERAALIRCLIEYSLPVMKKGTVPKPVGIRVLEHLRKTHADLGYFCMVDARQFVLIPAVRFTDELHVEIEPSAGEDSSRRIVATIVPKELSFVGPDGISPKEFSLLMKAAMENSGAKLAIHGKKIFDQNQHPTPLRDSVFGLLIQDGFVHSIRSPVQAGPIVICDIVRGTFCAKQPAEAFLRNAATFLFGEGCDLATLMTKEYQPRFAKMVGGLVKGLRFRVTHLGYEKIITAAKLVVELTPDSHKFDVDGVATSVAQYYKTRYHITVKNPTRSPMVAVKSDARGFNYFPLDVLEVCEEQRRAYSPAEVEAMARLPAASLDDKMHSICKWMHQWAKISAAALTLKYSGPLECDGQVFPETVVQYGRGKTISVVKGVWNLKGCTMVMGLPPGTALAVIYPDTLRPEAVGDTVNGFLSFIREMGIVFKDPPNMLSYCADPNGEGAASVLRGLSGETTDIILFVLPSKEKGIYERVSYICGAELGIPKQCIVQSNLLKGNPSVMGNVAISMLNKVRPKMGIPIPIGWTIKNIPVWKPSWIAIGVDVFHPPPASSSPSVAGFSMYVGPTVEHFFTHAMTQARERQEFVEKIDVMLGEALNAYTADRRPAIDGVVVFRDGLSDSQIFSFAKDEAELIQKKMVETAEKMRWTKTPLVTFVVVQKRNPCRLSVLNGTRTKFLTPPPGTFLCDMHVMEPHAFLLIPHAPVKGAVRPLWCVVGKNDLKLSLEDIARLQFSLCHKYGACTRSVSLPAPLYNAHKVAYFTGISLMHGREADNGDTASSSSGSSVREVGDIHLHEHLKRTAFFL